MWPNLKVSACLLLTSALSLTILFSFPVQVGEHSGWSSAKRDFTFIYYLMEQSLVSFPHGQHSQVTAQDWGLSHCFFDSWATDSKTGSCWVFITSLCGKMVFSCTKVGCLWFLRGVLPWKGPLSISHPNSLATTLPQSINSFSLKNYVIDIEMCHPPKGWLWQVMSIINSTESKIFWEVASG